MPQIRKNTKHKIQTPDLHVAPKVKTTAYSDINLKSWKDYAHVITDSLWTFPNRDKTHGHSYDYHGNYIPQIAQQLYERYTKKDDIVLDLFLGSGTSAIEAVNMGRRCIGVELKEDMVEYVSKKFNPKQLVTDVNINCGDSTSEIAKEKVEARLEIMGREKLSLSCFTPLMMILLSFRIRKKIYQIVQLPKNFMICFLKLQKMLTIYLKKVVLQH